MPRRQGTSALSPDIDEARSQIVAAAGATFRRYGVTKSTMDDIARQAGVSRPTLYRYFRDRDALLTAVIEERSHRLFAETHEFVERYDTLADRLVEGLLHLVDRGRQDPLIRLIVSPEHTDWATALMNSSGLAARLTHEMWAPLLATARERGEVRPEVTDAEITEWIALIELILAGRMDFGADHQDDHRHLLSRLMLPGIVSGGCVP